MKAIHILLLTIFTLNAEVSLSSAISRRYTQPYDIVSRSNYPWIVKTKNCTAIIVDNNKVIILGHCVNSEKTRENIKIDFYDGSKNIEIPICKLSIHPDYKGWSQVHDMAIMELAQSIALDIPSLDLPIYNYPRISDITNPMAAGFAGRAELRRVSFDSTARFQEEVFLKYVMQYQGIGEGGDSGSPLFIELDNQVIIYGFLSGGDIFDGGNDYYEALLNNSDFLSSYLDAGSGSGSGRSSDILIGVDSPEWQFDLCGSATSATSATSASLSFIALSIVLTALLVAI